MFKTRKYRKLTDGELVALIQSRGELQAIGVLYERYGHLVYGLALNYLKNKNDAEDVTSSVFEQLLTKIKRSEIQYFKSWLYTVAKNECLMFLRKLKPTQDIEVNLQHLNESSDENYALGEAQLNALEKEIAALKLEQKQCIQLFYLENKSYQQISDMVDLPVSKVKSAIQNGKRNLKISLEQYHEFKK